MKYCPIMSSNEFVHLRGNILIRYNEILNRLSLGNKIKLLVMNIDI